MGDIVHPNEEIHILALMPQLDPCPSKTAKTRHLFVRRFGDGAEEDNFVHKIQFTEFLSDPFTRASQGLPLFFHDPVLFFDPPPDLGRLLIQLFGVKQRFSRCVSDRLSVLFFHKRDVWCESFPCVQWLL